jgi:hypothetical protein
MPGLDYWPLGSLSPGQIPIGATSLVAIGGCLGNGADPQAGPGRCGGSWSSSLGNLHFDVVVGGTSQADGGPLFVQAAQLSPGLESLEAEAGAATVSFGPQDGGQTAVAQLLREGDLEPFPPTFVGLPAGLATFGSLGFAVDLPSGNASGHLWMSLAQSQELVRPAQDPIAYFGMGGTYVVAVIGDPNAPHAFVAGDGGYDGTGLHVLVLPTSPAAGAK